MTIGIIFAMKEEIEKFLKKIACEKTQTIYNLTFYKGTYKKLKLVIVESGIGKVNAARSTQILIDNYNPNYIFGIGIAGGVSKNLKILDIVASDKLIQHDFDITAFDHTKGYIPNIGTYINADKRLIEIAKQHNAIIGTIASGDIFCTEKNMSKKISQKFGALCVEMEGAAIAQVCKLCNVPFIIIRSISDCPGDNNKITYENFLGHSTTAIADFMLKILNNLIKTA